MTDSNNSINHETVLSRRSAIKKITVSIGVLTGISALPKSWTAPIIGDITLPAHAQTSGTSPCAVTAGPLHINAGDGLDITWSGGAGPQVIGSTYTVGSNTFLMTSGVFAQSEAAAISALGVTDLGLGGLFTTSRDPALCSFYAQVLAP